MEKDKTTKKLRKAFKSFIFILIIFSIIFLFLGIFLNKVFFVYTTGIFFGLIFLTILYLIFLKYPGAYD